MRLDDAPLLKGKTHRRVGLHALRSQIALGLHAVIAEVLAHDGGARQTREAQPELPIAVAGAHRRKSGAPQQAAPEEPGRGVEAISHQQLRIDVAFRNVGSLLARAAAFRIDDAHVFFTEACPRKFDDLAVTVKMLCAG